VSCYTPILIKSGEVDGARARRGDEKEVES